MGLKSFNPYTAWRFITVVDKSHITKQTPEKQLLEPKKRSGGRNNHGEIVVWHRGGGHKRQYRVSISGAKRTACPRRWIAISTISTARRDIAPLKYADGEKRYSAPVRAGRSGPIRRAGCKCLPRWAMP